MSRKKILTALFIIISGNITLVQAKTVQNENNASVSEKCGYNPYMYEDDENLEDIKLVNDNEDAEYYPNNDKNNFDSKNINEPEIMRQDNVTNPPNNETNSEQNNESLFFFPFTQNSDEVSSNEEKSIIKSKKFIEFMKTKASPKSNKKIELNLEDQRQDQVETQNKKRKHTLGHFRPGKKSGLDYLNVKNNGSILDQYQKKKHMRPILEIKPELFNERLFRRLVGIHEKQKLPQCYPEDRLLKTADEERDKRAWDIRGLLEKKSQKDMSDTDKINRIRSKWRLQPSSSPFGWNSNWERMIEHGNINSLHKTISPHFQELSFTDTSGLDSNYKNKQNIQDENIISDANNKLEVKHPLSRSKRLLQNNVLQNDEQKEGTVLYNNSNDIKLENIQPNTSSFHTKNENLKFETTISNISQVISGAGSIQSDAIKTEEKLLNLNQAEEKETKGDIIIDGSLDEKKKDVINYSNEINYNPYSENIIKSNSAAITSNKVMNELLQSNNISTHNKRNTDSDVNIKQNNIQNNKITSNITSRSYLVPKLNKDVKIIEKKSSEEEEMSSYNNEIGMPNAYEKPKLDLMQLVNPMTAQAYPAQNNESYILYQPLKMQANMPFGFPAIFPSNMYPSHFSNQYMTNPIPGTNYITPQKDANQKQSNDLITISIDPKTLMNKILHAEFINKTEDNKNLEMEKAQGVHDSNNTESITLKILESNPKENNPSPLKTNELQVGRSEKISKLSENANLIKSQPRYKSVSNNKKSGLVSFFSRRHKILSRNVSGENYKNNDKIVILNNNLEGIEEDQGDGNKKVEKQIDNIERVSRHITENFLNNSDDSGLSKVVVIQTKQKNPNGCPGDKICSERECSLIPNNGTELCQKTTLCTADFKELHEGRKRQIMKDPGYKISSDWTRECSTLKDQNICGNPCLGKKKTLIKREMNEDLLNIIKPVILLKPEEEEEIEDEPSRESMATLDKGNKKMENKILEGFINSIIANYSRGETKSEAKKTSETTTAEKESFDGREISRIVKDILRKREELPKDWNIEPIIVPESSISAFQNNNEYTKLGPFDERIIRSLFYSHPEIEKKQNSS